MSLFLGIVVVIIVSILLIIFLKGRNIQNTRQTTPEIASQKTEKTPEESQATYLVTVGDSLWSISEKNYNSGFSWTEIARANKIENPNLLEVGTKLVIPEIESEQNVTVNVSEEVKITDASYTVKSGDSLWDIAVRAYGDGYRWVEISKANNLGNPDIIHSGNKLTIPR